MFEGQPHIGDAMINGEIAFMVNTVMTRSHQTVKDSVSLRRMALSNRIPYYTTLSGAEAAVQAIRALQSSDMDVKPLQAYFG